MGQLLGHSKVNDNELGVAPLVWAGSAAAGPLAVLGLNKVFGGSDCSGSDKQKRSQIAELINQHLTYSDRRELVGMADSDISPTPKDMAYFMLGGKDCLHKNVSPGDKRFMEELPKRIEQRMQEKQQAQYALRQQQRQQQQSTGSGASGQQPSPGSPDQNGGQSQPPAGQGQQPPAPQGLIPGMSKNMSYVTIGGLTLVVLGTAVALSN